MSPMNPRLLRPLASGVHPEAAAWRAAVVAQGGSVSAATMRAVSTFCADIDAAGIRDRFYRLNLVAGTGLNAALVPLYRGPSRTGTQFGNTTDTNEGVFDSADYEETGASGGLQSNGTTKYLNTGLNQDTIPTLNNAHLSASLTNLGSGSERTFVGVSGSAASQFAVLRADSTEARMFLGAFTFAGVAVATSEAHLLGSRSANNLMTLYRSGSALGFSTSTVTPTTLAQPFFVFARNNNGSANTFTFMRLRMYSIGTAIDGASALAFSNAVTAFNTALNRA
jgi:hypothetical protein